MDNTHASRAVGPPAPATTGTRAVQLDTRCPQCERADMVGKVSALHAASTTKTTIRMQHQSITGEWSTARGSATTTTHLTRRLAPPRLPNWHVLPAALALFLAVALLCSLRLIAQGDMPPSIIAGVALVIVLMIAGLAGAVLLTVYAWRQRQAALPEFQKQLRHWQRLFHCGRCDKSFIPAQVKAASARK